MSLDLEEKRTNTSMATRAVTKENGDIFEIDDNGGLSPAGDSSQTPEEKKLLRKIDLWYGMSRSMSLP